MGRHATLLDLIDKHAASNIGYDQSQRWSWYGGNKIIPNAEGDCSAVTIGLIAMAGYPVPAANLGGRGLCWTGNAAQLLAQAGWRETNVRGWTVARIDQATGPGDALLGDGHIMIKAKNGLWYSMNIDENGHAYGGRAGDQTGRESSYVNLRPRSGGGWYSIHQAPDKTEAAKPAAPPADVLMIGSTGPRVKKLQQMFLTVFSGYAGPIRATGGADGIYGEGTAAVVREFQKRSKCKKVDGIAGKETFDAIAKLGIKL